MNYISVKNLSVYCGKHCALKDVDFTAAKGEFVAIVGKSGSGKTTFLHSLANFIPFSGQIMLPKAIGIVFQQYAVFPWLTVSKNIAFGLKNPSQEDQQQIIRQHLKLAELEDQKDKYPTELSGGQSQRVALARSLAHNPDVLLMDEPYGALDVYTRDKMQQWLLHIWDLYKKTIIFVTHNIEEAIFLADKVYVLHNKKFIKKFDVPFNRPRPNEIKFTQQFNELKKKILKSINFD